MLFVRYSETRLDKIIKEYLVSFIKVLYLIPPSNAVMRPISYQLDAATAATQPKLGIWKRPMPTPLEVLQ